jgi:hypothetical protein
MGDAQESNMWPLPLELKQMFHRENNRFPRIRKPEFDNQLCHFQIEIAKEVYYLCLKIFFSFLT